MHGLLHVEPVGNIGPCGGENPLLGHRAVEIGRVHHLGGTALCTAVEQHHEIHRHIGLLHPVFFRIGVVVALLARPEVHAVGDARHGNRQGLSDLATQYGDFGLELVGEHELVERKLIGLGVVAVRAQHDLFGDGVTVDRIVDGRHFEAERTGRMGSGSRHQIGAGVVRLRDGEVRVEGQREALRTPPLPDDDGQFRFGIYGPGQVDGSGRDGERRGVGEQADLLDPAPKRGRSRRSF